MIPGITWTQFPSSLNFTKHQFSSLSLCVPSSLDFDQSYFIYIQFGFYVQV